MGGKRVSEVSAGAGVRAGRMVNGISLTSAFIAGPGACEDGRPVGAKTRVHNELAEIGWFPGGSVRRPWVDGSEERI